MKKMTQYNTMKLGLLVLLFGSTASVLSAQDVEVIKPNASAPPNETLSAQEKEQAEAANRYIIQLQYQEALAKNKTDEGFAFFTKGKYEEAIKAFSESEEIIRTKIIQDNPRPAAKMIELRSKNRKMLSECYRSWASSLIRNVDDMGERPEPKVCQKAIDLLNQAKEIYPECAPQVNDRLPRYQEILLGQQFAQAVTPEGVFGSKEALDNFKAKQLQIETFMRRGQMLYTQKQYELARENFTAILRLDPTNIDAAHWMAKVNDAFLRAAYDHWRYARGDYLDEVERGLIRVIRPQESIQEQFSISVGEKIVLPLEKKMQGMIIDKISFENVPLVDVIEMLRRESRERDPSGKGINFFVCIDNKPKQAEEGAEEESTDEATTSEEDSDTIKPEDFPIDFKVEKRSFLEVLQSVINTNPDLRYRIDDDAVLIYTKGISTGAMQTEIFTIENAEGLPTDPAELKDYFSMRGVTFSDDARIVFEEAKRQLFVTNTADQIEAIRSNLEEHIKVMPQINISTRFVEVAQNDLQELGIDWMLTRVPPEGASKSSIPFRFGTSSVEPIQPESTSNDLATNGTTGNTGTGVGQGGQTGSTDAYLGAQPNALRSLGMSGIGSEIFPGTIGDKAFNWRHTADRRTGDPLNPNVPNNWGKDWSRGVDIDVVVRALSQSSTADVLAMPSITTCNGEPASIRMTTDVYYPIGWEEPNVTVMNNNNNNDNWGGNNNNNSGGSQVAVIGSVPRFGDPKPIGITLSVTPSTEPSDEHTILLEDLEPTVTSFVGWRDYSYILDANGDGLLEPNEEQTMIMPQIEKRTVKTKVYVGNGETLVLGGSIKDKVYTRVDKIPLLGDIPLFGRAFQNQAKLVESTNLLIFVTTRLVNTDGTPTAPRDASSEGRGTIDFDD